MSDDGGLPGAASMLAAQLLSRLGNRWAHVQAVASRAEALTGSVPARDRNLLVASAWLHDIGYAPELALTGFHPLDGARFLAARGFPDRLISLVAHHSGARYEAEIRGMRLDLAVYRFEDDDVMDALVCADMTTGPSGEQLTFSQRIEEIFCRYRSDSVVHQAIRRAEPYLSSAVTRTLNRLAISGRRSADS